MQTHRWIGITAALATLWLGSCGGSGSAPGLQHQGFTLSLLEASALDGGRPGRLSLRLQENAAGLEVRIHAAGAQGLKALYLTLDYDPAQYTPGAAQPLGEFAAPAALNLTVADQPGRLHYGQVLILPQSCAGFSGSADLVSLLFERRPFSAAPREVAAPPLTGGSRAPLRFQSADGMLVWQYGNQGDYDQNSETNIADLTPLAQHFGALAPGGPGTKFPLASVESQIDGDSNGEINLADITPIGLNFGALVEGWEVFSSLSETDYPASESTPSVIAPLQTLPFNAATGDPTVDRLEYSYALPAPVADSYYWVRPLHAGDEGIPSEMDGDKVVVVAPNVRIVDGFTGDTPTGLPGDLAYTGEFTLVGHTPDFGQITLTDPPGGDTILPGDVVVGFTYGGGGPAPDGGFLRKVSAVSSAGGDDLLLETTDEASLHDVFEKGGFMRDGRDLAGGLEIDDSLSLPHCGCGSGSLSASGHKSTDAYAIGFNADGVVLVDKHDGDDFYTVTLPQANFSFGPTFDVGVDFDKFLGIPYDLNSFHAIASGGIAANFEVLMDAEYHTTFTEEKLLYHVAKDEYFMIGPVPVLITFTLDVYGGVEGAANATFHSRFGFNLDYGVKMGILWNEDDGWSTLKEVTQTFNTIGPELNMNGDANCTVYLRPEAGFKLYHAIGAKIKIKPYLFGELDGSFALGPNPFCAHWNLDGGISADFGIYGKILGISLFDETFPLFDYRFDITAGELGCVTGPMPPEADFIFGPTYVIDDIGPFVVNFDATYIPPAPPFDAGGSYDPDGVTGPTPYGIKWYEWDFDGDGIIDLCSSDPTGSFTYTQKFHNYEATLWVYDEEGMVSSRNYTVYIDDPIG